MFFVAFVFCFSKDCLDCQFWDKTIVKHEAQTVILNLTYSDTIYSTIITYPGVIDVPNANKLRC